jgi:hypothetical protein
MRSKFIATLWPRFRQLTPARRALITEAALALAFARAQLVFVPFTRIAAHLGKLSGPASAPATANGAQATTAEEIAWAIDRAAPLLPFAVVCLPRALAAFRMLNRRGIPSRLHFGASRKPEKPGLNTHAWLEVGGTEVTGYPEAHSCIELGFYTR